MGFLWAILAALGFSTKAIFVKLAFLDSVDAVTLLTLRMLFSAPFFLAVALQQAYIKKSVKLELRDKLAIVVLGILGYYLSSLFDFIGLQYISAGLERLILFLYPTFVVILSALFLAKPFGKKECIALILSYAGMIFIFLDEINMQTPDLFRGSAFVFASTMTYSLYLIGAGETISRMGAVCFTAYAMLIACLATFLQFIFTHPVVALQTTNNVYELSFLMAVFSTVVPVFMLSTAIRLIGSSHTSLVGSLGPISTLLLANWILGESLSTIQIVGAVLVFCGVLSLTLKN